MWKEKVDLSLSRSLGPVLFCRGRVGFFYIGMQHVRGEASEVQGEGKIVDFDSSALGLGWGEFWFPSVVKKIFKMFKLCVLFRSRYKVSGVVQ